MYDKIKIQWSHL